MEFRLEWHWQKKHYLHTFIKIHELDSLCQAKQTWLNSIDVHTWQSFGLLNCGSWRIHVRSKPTFMWKTRFFRPTGVAELSCAFPNVSQLRSTTFPNQNKVRSNLQPSTSNFLTEKKLSPPEPAFMLPTSRENCTPRSRPCFPNASLSVVHT